jgi:hypothetical protein
MSNQIRKRGKITEREDSKFFKFLQGDIAKIRENLKELYHFSKNGDEAEIHEALKNLDLMKESLVSYLFDGMLVDYVKEERDRFKDLI